MKKSLVASCILIVFLSIGSVGLIAYVAIKASSAKQSALTQLKKDVARDLHDPDSVRFRDLKLLSYSDHLESLDRFFAFVQENSVVNVLEMLRNSPKDLLSYRESSFTLCGQLNAKNRMGAYVGYTDFFVKRNNPENAFVVIESLGWDKSYITKICNIGVVVSEPTDQ